MFITAVFIFLKLLAGWGCKWLAFAAPLSWKWIFGTIIADIIVDIL